MRVDIFDVGHGQRAVIIAPDRRRMMLDSGDRWGEESFWTPSLHYFRQTVDVLALMNLDEGHLSDFEGMIKDCAVPRMHSNPAIGPYESQFSRKTAREPGPMAVATSLGYPKTASAGAPADFGSVQIRYYCGIFVPGAVDLVSMQWAECRAGGQQCQS